MPSLSGPYHSHACYDTSLSTDTYVCVLQDAIRSGVDNLDSGVGVYAGDEEVYTVFAPLLDRVIEAYHRFPPVRALLVKAFETVVR